LFFPLFQIVDCPLLFLTHRLSRSVTVLFLPLEDESCPAVCQSLVESPEARTRDFRVYIHHAPTRLDFMSLSPLFQSSMQLASIQRLFIMRTIVNEINEECRKNSNVLGINPRKVNMTE
jgi:hypothetical protein